MITRSFFDAYYAELRASWWSRISGNVLSGKVMSTLRGTAQVRFAARPFMFIGCCTPLPLALSPLISLSAIDVITDVACDLSTCSWAQLSKIMLTWSRKVAATSKVNHQRRSS